MEQVMNLTFASSLTDLCELNSSFDRGILKIAYTGDNRNKSSISKQAFENCLKTMYNVPVVCNYDRETDTLGGHDMQVVRSSDGGLRLINATTPVGCVPESARTWWDYVVDDDGVEREYLFAEALLWKRQEAYRKIAKDGITAQSMEITVRDGKKIDGILHIYDFEFTAFCLIGVEPCYEGASLEMSLAADFKQQLSEMMQDLKESYTLVNPSLEVNNTHNGKISMEGGEKVLHDETELNAVNEAIPETQEFSAEEEAAEEAAELTEAEAEEAQPEDAGDESSPAEVPEDQGEAFALTSGVVDEIYRQLGSVTVEREWGTCVRYCYADSDLEKQEVYCWDTNDWLLYGFRYSVDGDSVTIDFDSKKRMKYVIVEFDNGEQESQLAQVFDKIEEKLQEGAQWEARYQTASDTIASMETELGELRQFKADTENAALKSAREEVFARFEDLVGVEAFEALRENCADFQDMDALEEKCYAIRGRAGKTAKFSIGEKTPRLKVARESSPEKEPYGGIFAHFGIEAE